MAHSEALRMLSVSMRSTSATPMPTCAVGQDRLVDGCGAPRRRAPCSRRCRRGCDAGFEHHGGGHHRPGQRPRPASSTPAMGPAVQLELDRPPARRSPSCANRSPSWAELREIGARLSKEAHLAALGDRALEQVGAQLELRSFSPKRLTAKRNLQRRSARRRGPCRAAARRHSGV